MHTVVQAQRSLVRVDAHTAQPPRCHHLPRQILRFHRAAARAGKRRRPRRRSSRRNMLAALPQTLHGTIAAPVAELHCALPHCHGARSAPDVPATLPDDGLPFSPDPFSIAGVVFCQASSSAGASALAMSSIEPFRAMSSLDRFLFKAATPPGNVRLAERGSTSSPQRDATGDPRRAWLTNCLHHQRIRGGQT